MKLPRLFGDYADTDTQFIQKLKQYQEWVFVGLCGLAILIIFMVVMTFTKGTEGTWRYAICRVFLERNSQYPPNLKLLFAGEKQTSAQIGYMVTNAFGSRQSELMECFYNVTQTGVRLNKVSSEVLNRTLPPPLPYGLEDLKQD
jgi:hypothetical protein